MFSKGSIFMLNQIHKGIRSRILRFQYYCISELSIFVSIVTVQTNLINQQLFIERKWCSSPMFNKRSNFNIKSYSLRNSLSDLSSSKDGHGFSQK